MIIQSRHRHVWAIGLCCVLSTAIWQWRKQPTSPHSAPTAAKTATSASTRPLPSPSTDRSIAEKTKPAPALDLAELQSEIEAALRENDYPSAHELIDHSIATSSRTAEEKQQLLAIKLGLFGRNGDHQQMLALMDQIIAENPNSALAANMAKQRAFVQDFAERDPHDSGMCETCNGHHAEGEPHLPPKTESPPKNKP
jgi:hypothetical protein